MGIANPLCELATVLQRMRGRQSVYFATKKAMQKGAANMAAVEQAKLQMREAEATAMEPANEIVRNHHLHPNDVVELARRAARLRKAQQEYFTYYNTTLLTEARRMESELDRRLDEILKPAKAESQTTMF